MESLKLASGSERRWLSLDPRTKLVILTVITSVMFKYNITGPFLGIVALPCILLLSNRQYKLGITYALLLSAAIYVKMVPPIGPLNPLLNGLFVLLVGFVLRLCPLFMMATYLMSSTTVSEFIASVERMHISKKFVIPLCVMFRFLPTIREESGHIGNAMRMRDVRFGTQHFRRNPACLLEYRIVPLLTSIVKIGDELSASALTRGLGDPAKRTSIAQIGFRPIDIVFLLISCVLVVSLVL